MKADLDVNLPIEYGPIPEFPPREGYVAPEPYDQLFPEEMAEQKEKETPSRDLNARGWQVW